jgi:hypothetical protein
VFSLDLPINQGLIPLGKSRGAMVIGWEGAWNMYLKLPLEKIKLYEKDVWLTNQGKDIDTFLLEILALRYGPFSLLLGKDSWSLKDPLVHSPKDKRKTPIFRLSKSGKLILLQNNLLLKTVKKFYENHSWGTET